VVKNSLPPIRKTYRNQTYFHQKRDNTLLAAHCVNTVRTLDFKRFRPLTTQHRVLVTAIFAYAAFVRYLACKSSSLRVPMRSPGNIRIPEVILFSMGVASLLWRRCLTCLRRSFAEPIPNQFPYYARSSLLSRGELAFYEILRTVLPLNVGVSLKVRLADVINCSGETWRLGYGRLIAQKHLDFVLFDLESTRVLLAIELDDRSHRLKDRRDRDKFVDLAMSAAKVPLLRVPASATYGAQRVESLIQTATMS
jgi:hypothetical protein